MSALNTWLNLATRYLSKDVAARVRSEIEQHYESSREAALDSGATAEEAEQHALAALGDAKESNREYREVLLTSAEAKLLRDGNGEARIICSRPWLKWLRAAAPVALMWTAVALYASGATDPARDLFAIGLMVGFMFAAPFLPVYTPTKARIFRIVKYVAICGALVLVSSVPTP